MIYILRVRGGGGGGRGGGHAVAGGGSAVAHRHGAPLEGAAGRRAPGHGGSARNPRGCVARRLQARLLGRGGRADVWERCRGALGLAGGRLRVAPACLVRRFLRGDILKNNIRGYRAF